MDEFNLTIELGNAAMGTLEDVRRALLEVADALAEGQTSARIRDENGNTVGTWEAA